MIEINIYTILANIFLLIVLVTSGLGIRNYWKLRGIDEYAPLRLILTGAGLAFAVAALVIRTFVFAGLPSELVSFLAGIVLALNYFSLWLVSREIERER